MPVLDLSQDRFDILAHRAMRLLGLEVFQKFLEFFSGVQAKIISRTEESHTHLEWLRFLKQIDRETPKELDLHLIVDNYATHNLWFSTGSAVTRASTHISLQPVPPG